MLQTARTNGGEASGPGSDEGGRASSLVEARTEYQHCRAVKIHIQRVRDQEEKLSRLLPTYQD